MNRFPIVLAAGCLSLCLCASAYAQFEISAKLAETRVMQYEPIQVEVTIRNNASSELHVAPSNAPARLVFDVESSPGQSVNDLPISPMEEFIVFPRQSRTVEVDLLRMYDVRATGPYTIRARLDWHDKTFSTSRMYLDVVPGLEIMSMITEDPETGSYRTFSLRSLQRGRRTHAFLRIEDEDAGVCYGLYDLGRLLRVQKPEMSLDGTGNVVILHQSGPQQFTQTTVSPAGRIIDMIVQGVDGEELRSEVMADRNELLGAQPMGSRRSGFQPQDILPLR